MKYTSTFVLVILAALLLASSTTYASAVDTTFTNILVSKSAKANNNRLYLNDNKLGLLRAKNANSSLNARNYADVLSRVFGMSPVNAAYDPTLLLNNEFTLAQASLTVVMPDMVGDVSISGAQAFDLTSAWESSPISVYNTAIRGVEADVHGVLGNTNIPRPIVSNPLQTVDILAAETSSAVNTVYDNMANVFAGKNSGMSVSSSFAWSVLDKKNIVDPTKITATEAFMKLGFVQDMQEDSFTYKGVSFVCDHFTHFAPELYKLATFTDAIKLEDVVDMIPDTYTVVLSGMSELSVAQQSVMIPFIQDLIAEVNNKLNQLYNNNVFTAVFALPAVTPLSAEEKDVAMTTLAKLSVNGLSHTFPLIVANNAKTSVCTQANEMNTNVHFTCMQSREAEDTFSSFLEMQSTIKLTLTPEEEQAQIDGIRHYHIVLWLALGLVGVLFMVLSTTINMPIAKDPALFGNLSPTWTKRN